MDVPYSMNEKHFAFKMATLENKVELIGHANSMRGAFSD